MRARLLVAIAGLAVAGLVLSSLSLINHYKTSASEYCDLSENFNCDVVNRSEYSELAGVPVAGIGIAGYLLLMVMVRLAKSNQQAAWGLFLAALVGWGFALYLTYIEKYVLQAWCILCLGSLVGIFLITLLAAVLVGMQHRTSKSAQNPPSV